MTAQSAPAADLGRLERLVRYPVKGFTGQDLPAATVRPGGGLPHDRGWAVANGTRPIAAGGGWSECQAFVRLTKNTDLPRYATQLVDRDAAAAGGSEGPASLHLRSPDGHSVQLHLDDASSTAELAAVDAALASWFPPGPLGPARLVESRHGLWDHSDAVLSLINLETVVELTRAAGRAVDPLRFRANLYLSGLPAWSEFGLIGRRIRLGEAELEVLRPTDRCRATAVDPDSAETDLNVPALLAAAYGHLYCGVYARVVTGGRLTPGQRLVDVGPAETAVREASTVSTAPPPAQWPRLATVADRDEDSATARSLWLRDPLAGLRPAPLPGQHVRVHAVDETGPLWRSYTISAVDRDRLRISVRQSGPDARMSSLLHRTAHPGSDVLISGPFGDMTLDPAGATPLVLASAGIGITPMVAMLRALAEQNSTRPVAFWHVARDRDELALWTEARGFLDQLPAGQGRLFLTRAATDTASSVDDHGNVATSEASAGRPAPAELSALVQDLGCADVAVYLCGPPGFLADMRTAAIDGGVPPSAVQHEVFVSPRPTTGESIPPPLPGPFAVRFTTGTEGDIDAVWRPEDGSLLDVADAAGLALPAGCRSGACGTCAQPVTAGSTAYLSEPVLEPPRPTVLLCCAVPTSEVTVDTGRNPAAEQPLPSSPERS